SADEGLVPAVSIHGHFGRAPQCAADGSPRGGGTSVRCRSIWPGAAVSEKKSCLAASVGPGGGCPGHCKMIGQAAAITDPLSRRCGATPIVKEGVDTAACHKRKLRMRQEGRGDVASGTG